MSLFKQIISNLHFFVGVVIASCNPVALTNQPVTAEAALEAVETPVRLAVGAERTGVYLPLLRNKRVGVVVNPTSRIGDTHLVDSLLARGILVAKIFSPEHGFRGSADAGEVLKDETDARTGLPIISLYGDRKKPRPEDLSGLDILVFDLQDVGARFYTYLSTMHYVMEACAENGIPLMVFDRPNPNGHYVDGPVLDPAFRSFVGMHPIPMVHGMTLGELARMINGERWLKDSVQCELAVVSCDGYSKDMAYDLPVRPSPNLPNMRSIYLYPSLCLFEGTVVSVGRGTEAPFQLYGAPDFPGGTFQFRPESMPGARYPLHEGKICQGYDLRALAPDQVRSEGRVNLSYLIDFYRQYPDKRAFFLSNGFIDKLAGTEQLRLQIGQGWTEELIRASWQEGLEDFREKRKPYLLY